MASQRIPAFATRFAWTANSGPSFWPGWSGISVFDGVVHRRAVLSPEECAAWVRGVYAARAHWTRNFEGVQFTVGRAWYTHLEEDATDDYFAGVAASDALVEQFLPGLQARVL